MNQLGAQFRRDVKYLNKDFPSFRRDLINFAKVYFPDVVNDFSEANPFTLLLELQSAVGDSLSFYNDTQLRESLLASVEEKINLYNLSAAMGYRVRTRTPSQAKLDVYQLVPAIGEGALAKPDLRYAQIVASDMLVSSTSDVKFRTIDSIDFRASSSLSPTETVWVAVRVLPQASIAVHVLINL